MKEQMDLLAKSHLLFLLFGEQREPRKLQAVSGTACSFEGSAYSDISYLPTYISSGIIVTRVECQQARKGGRT